VLFRSKDGGDTLLQDEVDMPVGAAERHFAVKLTRESSEDNEYGFVLTFDDTTELLKAQRASAWADVARRIAHEMKNPLTPIQLSAERIRRKYGQMVANDRKVLDDCTNTIVSRVSDIKRMVDEFSDFARMPQPVMEPCDVREIVSDVAALYQNPDNATSISFHMPDSPLVSMCDRGLLSQALINMVKNAGEAIEAVRESDPLLKTYPGRIDIHLNEGAKEYKIEVIDNGCGLPKEQRNRLLEPYITTREKGTGLGLAIVQKIIEQHGGRIVLEDAPPTADGGSGAKVGLILPFRKKIRSKDKDETTSIGNHEVFQSKMHV
jgi:two-component system nitrogen regulation sensor histidine kinase NtrY